MVCHSAQRSSSRAPVYVLFCTSCVESTPNMTEKKKEGSNHHKWRASRKAETVGDLETLPTCTKPRTSLHRLLRGGRHKKKAVVDIALGRRLDLMYNCHSDQEWKLLQRHHWETSETKTGSFFQAQNIRLFQNA